MKSASRVIATSPQAVECRAVLSVERDVGQHLGCRPKATSAVNKWIIGEVVETVAALDKAMEDMRFDAAAAAIYRLCGTSFCDWYIELIKGRSTRKPRLWQAGCSIRFW
jgi:valyl-tRNA synthetase